MGNSLAMDVRFDCRLKKSTVLRVGDVFKPASFFKHAAFNDERAPYFTFRQMNFLTRLVFVGYERIANNSEAAMEHLNTVVA